MENPLIQKDKVTIVQMYARINRMIKLRINFGWCDDM